MSERGERSEELHGLPMVPLRDIVVFPHTMVPFVVGRKPSLLAVERARAGDKRLFLSTQRNAKTDAPSAEEINSIGTIATVVQHLKLGNGNVKLLVEGICRASLVEIETNEDQSFQVLARSIEKEIEVTPAVQELMSRVSSRFERYIKHSPGLQYETMLSTIRISEPGRLADTISAHLTLEVEQKQALLETISAEDRLRSVAKQLDSEIEKLRVDKKIHNRVKKQMEKAQKEYYLNEKMKAIQQELGRKEDRRQRGPTNSGARSKRRRCRSRSEREGASGAEATGGHASRLGRIDRLAQLPGVAAFGSLEQEAPASCGTSASAEEDPRRGSLRLGQGQGADPRVPRGAPAGQEGLAGRSCASSDRPAWARPRWRTSIARATGRKFVRLSLGGVRDEAEIRGHRRTYIGAFPGQIIQMMRKAGTRNPVFLLDEVDKMAADFRGDPSVGAARGARSRAEPLVPRSLPGHGVRRSEVMFIATANVLHTIPPALKDRMEVLRSPGLHAEREDRDRRALPGSQAAQGSRPAQAEIVSSTPTRSRNRRALHEGGRRAQPGARDRLDLPQAGAQGGRNELDEVPWNSPAPASGRSCSASRATTCPARRDRASPRSVWPSVWPGPRSAARSCRIEATIDARPR